MITTSQTLRSLLLSVYNRVTVLVLGKTTYLCLELQKTVTVSPSGVQRTSESRVLWSLHSMAPDVPTPRQCYINAEGDGVREAAGLEPLTEERVSYGGSLYSKAKH